MTLDSATVTVLLMFAMLIVVSIGIGLWNAIKIREVHLTMNSRMDQLLLSSIAEGHAAGVKEERGRETERALAGGRETERQDSSKKAT